MGFTRTGNFDALSEPHNCEFSVGRHVSNSFRFGKGAVKIARWLAGQAWASEKRTWSVLTASPDTFSISPQWAPGTPLTDMYPTVASAVHCTKHGQLDTA